MNSDAVILSGELPDCKYTSGGNPVPRSAQPLTTANLAYVLQRLGLGVRLNVMDQTIEWRDETGVVGDCYRLVSDWLKRVDIVAQGELPDVLGELAGESPFHPMDEWLAGVTWDGVDRIGALADTVTTDNELWPVYLENWLVQVVEAVRGWRAHPGVAVSLPYVLVLVGGQGVGKSRWLSRLGGRFFRGEAELHLSTAAGKDHQIEALKWPMVELAELDGIFRKSDVSHMKSFISREQDAIRMPYARRAVTRPRMTAFCGSVNEAEFLNDPSGSRRFWPVLVDGIAWDFEMDWRQLWAQAAAAWAENPSFALTEEEDALRVQAAGDHTLMTAEEEKIRGYLAAHMGNPAFPVQAMNRTEILEMLYGKGRIFSNAVISQAGRVLSDMLGRHRTISGKQRSWQIPYNEFAQDVSTWPDKYHIKSV